MNFELEKNEIIAILSLMGETPAKNGFYPLMVKIQEQIQKQEEKTE